MKFTLRDLFWLALVISMGTMWLIEWSRRVEDRSFYISEINELKDKLRAK